MIKTVKRIFFREPLVSFINLMGLSISFCCFLIIFMYLRSELSVDSHFENHDRIYRLIGESRVDGVQTEHAKTGTLVAPLLAQDYSEFSNFVRFNPVSLGVSTLVLNEEIGIQWEDGLFNADNSVFDIFDHTILAGNPETALTEPRTIAISETVARLYFGDENPIGQTLSIQVRRNEFVVDLVFADLPDNTSLKYDILFNYNNRPLPENVDAYFEQGIVNFNDYTYFLLPDNYDVSRFSQISRQFFDRYIAGPAQRMFPDADAGMEYRLQPLNEIYFAPALDEDLPKGSPFNMLALTLVGIFIMLIASINYMNLSTARFTRRAREAGVKRTLGAGKYFLMGQFLGEGVVFSLCSLVLGLCLAEIILSSNLAAELLGMREPYSFINQPQLLIESLGISVVIGLLAGSYPALFFSSVKPVQVFSGRGLFGKRAFALSEGLIALQMLVSIAVIASAMIMFLQIRYLQEKPLGFEKENKLDITVNIVAGGSEFRTLVNELNNLPGVNSASMTDFSPGTVAASQPVLMRNEQGIEMNPIVNWYVVDENYLDTMKIRLAKGRNFDGVNAESGGNGNNQYIVNQTLVDQMGWDEPIGKELSFQVSGDSGTVVGVIEDFNFLSLHEEIAPLSLEPFYDNYRWQRHILLDVDPQLFQKVLQNIEVVMGRFAPDTPFEYKLVEESLNALYESEIHQLWLIMAGSLMCIFIAMLGLIGLTSYTLEQKSKEIGIRRILGASAARIVALLFHKVFFIVIVSSVIASFLVFTFLGRWLALYPYRIDISISVFLLASALVLLLAAFTIIVQAMRMIREKPVNALRYE